MAASNVQPDLDEAARAQILLALTPDVGPILRTRLLERFETAACVFAASEHELQQVQGIGPKISRRLINARHEVQLDAQLAIAREHGLTILLPEWPGYPRSLKEIPGPPGVLFVRATSLSGAGSGTVVLTTPGRCVFSVALPFSGRKLPQKPCR